MRRAALIDSGPLVALLNRRDAWHEWTVEQVTSAEPPLLTCESVLSEALFLLRKAGGGPAEIAAMLESGALRVAVSLVDEGSQVFRILRKYADRPASLADACLVRMSEVFPRHHVLTLDADFRHYRRHRNRAISVWMPDA